MEILTEFDVYMNAMKQINLNESAIPLYKGKVLVENADAFRKIQKLLNCDKMENSHMWLYDLDVENLDESEKNKINNLYKLGCAKGYIEEDEEDKEAKKPATECDCVEPQLGAPVQDPAPVIPAKPICAYTAMYSAINSIGEIKTGEAYSNAISPIAAKLDIMNKLEKAGYHGINILCIEVGDNCCADANNEPVVEPTSSVEDPVLVSVENDKVEEDDEKLDEVMLKRDEAKVKEVVKKITNDVNKEVGDLVAPSEIKQLLDNTKHEIETTRKIIEKTGDKNAVACYDKIISFLDNYSTGKISEDDVNEAKTPSSGIGTVVRGLVKILLTLFKLTSLGIGFSGKLIIWVTNLLATGADKLNMQLKDSEDTQLSEADDKEDSDDKEEDNEEDSDKEADDKEEDSDKEADDKEDEDKKEEKAEEPDEKLKDDSAEDKETSDKENDKETSDDEEKEKKDDKEDEEELSDEEKKSLKDSYKKAFKAAMLKCKFEDKSFDDLTLEEKVTFFTTLNSAWKKADPSKFMDEKELEALEKIVVKK